MEPGRASEPREFHQGSGGVRFQGCRGYEEPPAGSDEPPVGPLQAVSGLSVEFIIAVLICRVVVLVLLGMEGCILGDLGSGCA